MAELFTRQAGDKNKHAILLIHGVAGSGLLFEPMMKILAVRHHVIAIDLLGYGHSPKPKNSSYEVDTHALAIHKTLSTMKFQRPYSLVGLSMGALIALKYSELFADEISDITCIGLPYYRNSSEAKEGLKENFWIHLTLAHPYLARVIIPPISAIGRRFKFIQDRVARPIYSGAIAKEVLMVPYYAFSRTLNNVLVGTDARKIVKQLKNQPLLLIHGTDDKWSPLERIHEFMHFYKPTELQTIEHSPHNTVFAAPQKTAEIIESFLDRARQAVEHHTNLKSKFTIVGQGGGMVASYHIGVIQALQEKYPQQMKNLHRVVAASGAAAIFSYFVSEQAELQVSIFDCLFDSHKFVVPQRFPPGKHMMDIDFLVDEVIKNRFPLDVKSLKESQIKFDVGVTDYVTGRPRYIEKNSPEADNFYELIRASCAVPYFGHEPVSLGRDRRGLHQFLDGNIGSVSGVDDVGNEENIIIILTRPLAEPLPQRILVRKLAAWLLMRSFPPQIRQAIWNMLTQVGSLPGEVEALKKTRNVVVLEPSTPIDMWRIEIRKDGKKRLHKTIRQGYNDTMNNIDLEEFFKKIN